MYQRILSYINKGHQRSAKAKKNILVSFFIKGISTLVILMLVPMSINFISVEEYGVWITLSSIVTWFSFFDIGFGQGLRNKLAECFAKNELDKARIYISTTYAIIALIVIALWSVFFISNHFINWCKILNVPGSMQQNLQSAVLILFSFFCMQFVLKLLGTILLANQESAKASLFDMLGQLFTLITILILHTISQVKGNIVYLATISGAAQVGVLVIASVWYFTGTFKQLRPAYKYVNFSYAKSLMGLGLKFFIIQFAAVFIFETTNIVITQLLGPSKVTVYSILFRYFSVATMLCNIIATPFWSAFTEAYVKQDIDWMKGIVVKLNKFWLGLTAVILFMLALSQFVFQIWIKDAVHIDWDITILMAINIIIVTRFNLYILLINGTGKISLQLYINVILSFVFIPMAILLGNKAGLAGIVLANILVNLVYAIVAPMQSSKLLNNTAKGIWNR